MFDFLHFFPYNPPAQLAVDVAFWTGLLALAFIVATKVGTDFDEGFLADVSIFLIVWIVFFLIGYAISFVFMMSFAFAWVIFQNFGLQSVAAVIGIIGGILAIIEYFRRR